MTPFHSLPADKQEHFIVELQKAKQNYFKDRSIYESSLKQYRDLYSVMKTAQQDGFDAGEAKGKAEGIEIAEKAKAAQEDAEAAKAQAEIDKEQAQAAKAQAEAKQIKLEAELQQLRALLEKK